MKDKNIFKSIMTAALHGICNVLLFPILVIVVVWTGISCAVSWLMKG